MLLLQANIEAELDKLCNHLPKSLTDQCTDFVKSYSKELVEMLLADLTPQEVCVYLKLCDPTKDPGPKQSYISEKDGEICELLLHSLQFISIEAIRYVVSL
jgi:saposin